MTYLIAIAFFFLGAVVASFAAVVAERLHTGESWVRGRSRCNSCATLLSAIDLVPVLSSIRGRARCCGARIPRAYGAGEAILGGVFVLAYLALGFTLPLFPFLLALSVLAFIVFYDLRHTVVPPTASTLLILTSVLYALSAARSPSEAGLALLVAGGSGLLFFALHFFSGGRAMGLGDAPVALALALLTGPYLAIPGLLFSFWIGALVGIAILVRRPRGHRMGIEVPFVPFLAAGYLLAYFTQWNPLLLSL
jgi:leader peptidase (prepilin peptidase)/N-methyltransferase